MLKFAVFLIMLFNSVSFAAVRNPAVAGRFYPKNADLLRSFIESSLEKSGKTEGRIVALLSPHAGYEFSGRVAAAGYSRIGGGYDTVILIGPAHRAYVEKAAVYPDGYFSTPLGKVKIDEAMAKELLKNPLFSADKEAHKSEHSLETQLPFLQVKLKEGFKILPILANTEKTDEIIEIGDAIAKAAEGKRVLIVASSDLSHYPREKIAAKADGTILKALSFMDEWYFMQTAFVLKEKRIKNYVTPACGKTAVAITVRAAKKLGADEFVLLKYSDSYRENAKNASPESVVGYASGLFIASGKGLKTRARIELGEKQKRALLARARRSIMDEFEGRETDKSLSADINLNLPAAVFVTLTKNGVLRGCVGTTAPLMTLNDAVGIYARAAAFSDRRFPPVGKKEMKDVEIEISLLSPLRPVESADEIIPRKDGVVVAEGEKNGLFLPQVWEQIPDKNDFLSELCSQKAGLPRDCWKNGAKLFVFSAEAFSEQP